MRVLFFLVLACAAMHERVLLKDVQVLTLRSGAFTTGRRNSPIAQLSCQNCADDAARRVVDTIQCRNVGFDGRDVNWKCETEIGKEHKLGRTEVSCEGYESPDDPFILAGSCAVEYFLHSNPRPAAREWVRPQQPKTIVTETMTVSARHGGHPPESLLTLSIFFIGFVACVFAILCCCNCCIDRLHHVHAPSPVYYPPAPSAPPYYATPSFDFAPPPVVVHRHTTTVVHEEPPPRHRAPSPVRHREPSPEKHTSVSYATTKRR